MRRADLSAEVRQRLKRLPAPHAAHYGVVPAPPPEDAIPVIKIAGRHEAARNAIVRADAIAQELQDPYLVSRLLPRREAVSSSSIEGTYSTLDEILSGEETVDADMRSPAKQVRAYAIALEGLIPKAREVGSQVFTKQLILDLQRAVMTGDPDYADEPGRLRDRVVWIGGTRDIAYSTWNPPPPEDVEGCLEQTVAYLRNEGMQSMTQSLVTRMAVAHAHFEAVHPFRDGNGRVGRLLLPIMMAADGHVPLYLSPYIESRKQQYYDALKAAQQRLDWAAVIGFLSDAVVGTVEELLATRSALESLRQLWLSRRRFRKGSAALEALSLLPHYPVVTVSRLAALLNISTPQAARAVVQLEQAGILKERTGYRRNRIFAAEEALSIVNRPFGSEPVLPGSSDASS